MKLRTVIVTLELETTAKVSDLRSLRLWHLLTKDVRQVSVQVAQPAKGAK